MFPSKIWLVQWQLLELVLAPFCIMIQVMHTQRLSWGCPLLWRRGVTHMPMLMRGFPSKFKFPLCRSLSTQKPGAGGAMWARAMEFQSQNIARLQSQSAEVEKAWHTLSNLQISWKKYTKPGKTVQVKDLHNNVSHSVGGRTISQSTYSIERSSEGIQTHKNFSETNSKISQPGRSMGNHFSSSNVTAMEAENSQIRASIVKNSHSQNLDRSFNNNTVHIDQVNESAGNFAGNLDDDDDILEEKEARRDEKLRFTCKCSFLEIYNEQILDLLEPSSNNLQIREDIKKGVYVENLKEIEVTSARDVIQQLIQGASNRKVASTNMNRASSRSHSVFTCIIESVSHHQFARLNLVDLAGSERQKSSGAEGERLKEATNINKSLSTLGLVIMNLVNMSNGKSLHVPYQDSKLTFLLQDSLRGNSKTTIIANISPSSW